MRSRISSQPDRVPDAMSESRLQQLRNKAAVTPLKEKGIRPAGAPFPMASPETGYYGVPLLKPPQWRWEVPAYFFVGGAAGASAVIAAVAEILGRDPQLVKDAKVQAAIGGILSPVLLTADLGRPSRFLNMLRVFKYQSAMSVGAWNVMLFSMAAVAAAVMDAIADGLPRFARPILTRGSSVASAATGLVMSSYTGVLIGVTSVPVWNRNLSTLPGHFAASGLNSAIAVLELMGHDESRPLNLLGIGAAAAETVEGAAVELERGPVNDPLKQGKSGLLVRAGGVLSGPVPLLLRLASLFTTKSRARKMRRAAAACSLAGSVLTRYGWISAGQASTQDYRLPLDIPAEPRTELTSLRPSQISAD